MAGVLAERKPFFLLQSSYEFFLIESGTAGKRKYGTVFGIDRNDGTLFILKQGFSEFLEIHVERQPQIPTGYREYFIEKPHPPAHRVDFYLTSTPLSVKILLESSLNA